MVSNGNSEQNHQKTLTSSKIHKLWIITLDKSFQGHFEYWKVIFVNQNVNESVAWQGLYKKLQINRDVYRYRMQLNWKSSHSKIHQRNCLTVEQNFNYSQEKLWLKSHSSWVLMPWTLSSLNLCEFCATFTFTIPDIWMKMPTRYIFNASITMS